MEKTNNASLYWYVFYNDQLLLQKKAEGYVIPCTDEAPVTVARSLPVEMQDGTMAMAAFNRTGSPKAPLPSVRRAKIRSGRLVSDGD